MLTICGCCCCNLSLCCTILVALPGALDLPTFWLSGRFLLAPAPPINCCLLLLPLRVVALRLEASAVPPTCLPVLFPDATEAAFLVACLLATCCLRPGDEDWVCFGWTSRSLLRVLLLLLLLLDVLVVVELVLVLAAVLVLVPVEGRCRCKLCAICD